MKKIFLTIFILSILFAVGCGSKKPSPGVWEGNVYTNEYLGLRFVLPPGWAVPTDAEMAQITGIAQREYGDFFPDDMDEFFDMVAVNRSSGANVNLNFVRHGRRVPTVEDVFEEVPKVLESIGGRVTRNSGTTRLGDNRWNSHNTAIEMFGVTMNGRQFFIIQDGFIITITITAGLTESIESVLPWFFGMNDSLPNGVER
jgi:hypothetical protein